MVLGENPACSCGAPVQIDWVPMNSSTRDLNLYDYLRKDQRRSRKGLTISVPKRAHILMSAGYSIGQIADALMQVQSIQKQRSESLQVSGLGERVQLLIETTGRLPKGIMKGMLKIAQPKQKMVQARTA